jgi:hypothetical protein
MPLLVGNTSRAVPTLASDTTNTQARVSQYGDLCTTQYGDDHSSLADEGLYFKAFNTQTPGTGQAMTTLQTSFNPLRCYLQFQVPNIGDAKVRVFLDYIRLMCTVAGTASTTFQAALVVDYKRATTTAGTLSLGTNVNNAYSRNNAIAQVWAGDITIAAASTLARTVFRTQMRTATAPTLAVGDLYSFDFGEVSQQSLFQGTTTPAAAASSYPHYTGPLILSSDSTVSLHIWGAAMTAAPSFEFEVGWWER